MQKDTQNNLAVRVKICGLTREQDVDAAVLAGVDAIGFVFVSRSSRNVDMEQARRLAARLPAFVSCVALFLDAGSELVEQVIRAIPVDLLQFHGNENPAYCRQFDRRYIKAVSMSGETAIADAERLFHDAAGLLLDSHAPGELGGSGRTFDWRSVLPVQLPVILAGGLHPGNVAEAVSRVRPWAVDVSSGVESSPGIKDAGRMRRFVALAKGVPSGKDV